MGEWVRNGGLERPDDARGGVRLCQDRPNAARMSDYYLGGKTNYVVDRDAADEVIRVFPAIRLAARVNHAFMIRAARLLASRYGIEQFLDVGAGIPTSGHLHESVQALAPRARFVYVDDDPLALLYAESSLVAAALDTTRHVEAEIAEPELLVEAVRQARFLDFRRPLALSLNAVLHFLPDARDPYGVVRRLVRLLPRGSFVTLSHWTRDFDAVAWAEVADIYSRGGTPVQVRSRDEVSRFLHGLEPVEPGLVVAHRWRPEPASGPSLISDAQASLYAAVARIP